MRYVHLQQGTDEWLAWRALGMSASNAPAVMGIPECYPTKKPKTAETVFLELTGQAEPEAQNYAMRRGIRREPVARREYERRTGRIMEPCCGEHDELTWLRASFDGINLFGDLILEVKWPNFKVHRAALEGRVVDYYVPQVQQQLFVSGAERCHFLSCSEKTDFSLSDRFALVTVEPDAEYLAGMMDQLLTFWEKVQAYRKVVPV